MDDKIRGILRDHGRLSADPMGIADDQDLYQAGLTSHASVSVMLALEDAFDIEFPDAMLRRDLFDSIAHIRDAVGQLTQQAA
jgi:acyl carrier protein